MAKRYQHVGAEIRRRVARRVGRLLWSAADDEVGDLSGAAPSA